MSRLSNVLTAPSRGYSRPQPPPARQRGTTRDRARCGDIPIISGADVSGVPRNRHTLDICVGCDAKDVSLWKKMYATLPKLDALAGLRRPSTPIRSFNLNGKASGSESPWSFPGSITMTNEGTETDNMTRLAHEYGHQVMEHAYPRQDYIPTVADPQPSTSEADGPTLESFYRGLHELVADTVAVLYVGDLACTGRAERLSPAPRFFDRPFVVNDAWRREEPHAMYGPARAHLGRILQRRHGGVPAQQSEARAVLETVLGVVGDELQTVKELAPTAESAAPSGFSVMASNRRVQRKLDRAMGLHE